MTINRRLLVASCLGALLMWPMYSFAQTETDPDEIGAIPADATGGWADAAEHAQVHGRLRAFLGSVIGRPREERLEIASAFLSDVDPLDPTYVLAESAAYGVLVRGNPIQEALSEGYHRSSKEGLLFAISEYPDSPWTAMMNSAWHYEVIRRSTIGAAVMGASGSKGAEFMADALTDAPADPGLYLAAAISLLSEKPKSRASQASELLDRGAKGLETLETMGGAEGVSEEYIETVREHIMALKEIMATGQPKDAKAYVLEIF